MYLPNVNETITFKSFKIKNTHLIAENEVKHYELEFLNIKVLFLYFFEYRFYFALIYHKQLLGKTSWENPSFRNTFVYYIETDPQKKNLFL